MHRHLAVHRQLRLYGAPPSASPRGHVARGLAPLGAPRRDGAVAAGPEPLALAETAGRHGLVVGAAAGRLVRPGACAGCAVEGAKDHLKRFHLGRDDVHTILYTHFEFLVLLL